MVNASETSHLDAKFGNDEVNDAVGVGDNLRVAFGKNSLSGVNRSFKKLTDTISNAMDNVMIGLQEEEVERVPSTKSQEERQSDDVKHQVDDKIEKAVISSDEFRHLQQEMRASGMTTGVGTKAFLVSMAEERRGGGA